jgi:hypothetical protein
MQRKLISAGLAVVLVMTMLTATRAAESTFSGTLVCAFCGLKKADATACQDVLLVTDARGSTTEYYIAKNEVTSGEEACTLKIPATVTGEVFERDGRTWIAPTKIDKKP